MPKDRCGPGRTYNEAKRACEISECIEPATYAGMAGISSGPQNAAFFAGLTYAACKGFRSLESSSTVPRPSESSTQNRNQFDSTQQISVDDRERYYQDPDPVMDHEFDTWQTEEDFVDVDIEQDLTEDFDFRPS